MATNLTIESPDFDRIGAGDPRATQDAVRLLWMALNSEASTRRQVVRKVGDRWDKAVLASSPTVAQNNLAYGDVAILRFDGSTAFNLTGIRAGLEGSCLLIMVLGSATVTLKDDDANSDAINRILTNSGADLAVATNKGVLLSYLNARWREVKWA
jgi:hypothetical protein